jgi:hypothetical protein
MYTTIPTLPSCKLSDGHRFGDQVAFEALTRFSGEERKHQTLFRFVAAMVGQHPAGAGESRRRLPRDHVRPHGSRGARNRGRIPQGLPLAIHPFKRPAPALLISQRIQQALATLQ